MVLEWMLTQSNLEHSLSNLDGFIIHKIVYSSNGHYLPCIISWYLSIFSAKSLYICYPRYGYSNLLVV